MWVLESDIGNSYIYTLHIPSIITTPSDPNQLLLIWIEGSPNPIMQFIVFNHFT
jgi:hypothetical protein